ncbi:zinc-dependent alcohol dehydrogenase family protein [Ohtaekwangia sp.]|uniref:zinc-dependent alcohol dehydrogenase family protein n=1 Tax=Ohtaekwangia sp. TaxID=2066019 RepID=UPI002F923103
MKALQLTIPGTLRGIEWKETPTPVIGDYDVLVRIHATSLNYRDYAFITGRYPLVKPLPVILGSDAAGMVERVGKLVTRFAPGDRVVSLLRQRWQGGKFDAFKASQQLGATVDGVFSEYYAFHEQSIAKAPTTLTMEEAATITTAGLTAFRVLTQSGVQPGDTVLIQGTGSVSLYALQLSQHIGLRTIVTTGRQENEEFLKQLGAHHVINYKEHPEWSKPVLDITQGRGVDLVMDVAGGSSVQQSIHAAAVGGHIALIGFLDDTRTSIDLVSVIRRNITLQAYTTGSREDLEQFVKFLEIYPVRPFIAGVYTDYATAFAMFENNKTPGKIIVKHG